jgi:uncharacterized protein (DUF433 family)
MRTDWHNYISVDPEIHHGEPCIKGTRIPVSVIVRSIAAGMTHNEIIDAYPQLTQESTQAAMCYESDRIWDRLVRIGEELGKGWHSEKSAVEILSEMRR